ncbi:hypothetical protein A2U01_0070614 [Trifolium medium]|uniref:Uncharacterized protein n=1 Tax=Trifolium medium TaxID=97028 RepID=A0A392SN74_9FABA|nr:hypothetical protein [Trifolium medium]
MGDLVGSEMGVVVAAATDLSRRCGGEVLLWRCWIWHRRCVVDVVCDWFSRYGFL